MTDVAREAGLREKLGTVGDPREIRWSKEAAYDYVQELGLTADDAPFLLRVAREWIERTDWPEDKDDMSGYAPVHAWRAAAQLAAPGTAGVLLDMIGPMDEADSDWHLEEFPTAFGYLGPTAVEPSAVYLADDAAGEYARVCISDGLTEIALRHPGQRDRVVEILGTQLEHYESQTPTLNSFLVNNLLKLDAGEAAETIEDAFAADVLDLLVCGNWNMVREQLGVEGRGIVPRQLATESPTARLRAELSAQGVRLPMPAQESRHVPSSNPRPKGKGRKGRGKGKRRR